MPEYEITPEGPWRSAIECTVLETATGKETKNVQIVRFFPSGTSEVYPIQTKKLPLLVLNEMNPEDSQDGSTILDGQHNLEKMQITLGQDPFDVDIIQNTGWPTGKIIVEKR
jgi:hypothetical protein